MERLRRTMMFVPGSNAAMLRDAPLYGADSIMFDLEDAVSLKELGVTSAEVIAVDKGALDCTIQARTVTVVHRAAEVENYDWKEIDSWNA